MLVLFFAADVGFVGFCDAAQEIEVMVVFFTCFADALEEKPCALLGYVEFFGQLGGGYAFARDDHFIKGVNPFVQWDVGVLEDGACPYGVNFAAMGALKIAFFAFALDSVLFGGGLAFGAGGVAVPAALFEIEPRRFLFLVGKVFEWVGNWVGGFG